MSTAYANTPMTTTPLKSGAVGPSIVDRVGNTPLIGFARITADLPDTVRVLAKCEWHNPAGSVKDRPALNMIREGERSGALTPDKTLLDATSGNTGIAYAMFGAALGYKVKLALPGNAGKLHRRILEAYGAELVITDPAEASDGAIREAKRLYEENPDAYFFPDQYNNPANWQAHYHGTAPEIWQQTDGNVTHFVAGLGTSGTFTGTSRRLREYNPDIRIISAQPDTPLHALEGWKHMETSIKPGFYDDTLADENLEVRTEDSFAMVKRLAAEEGLLVSPSAGAAVTAALQVARTLTEGTVVTVLPDNAAKYLDHNFW